MSDNVDDALNNLVAESDNYVTVSKQQLRLFWKGAWGIGYQSGFARGKEETVTVQYEDVDGALRNLTFKLESKATEAKK